MTPATVGYITFAHELSVSVVSCRINIMSRSSSSSSFNSFNEALTERATLEDSDTGMVSDVTS